MASRPTSYDPRKPSWASHFSLPYFAHSGYSLLKKSRSSIQSLIFRGSVPAMDSTMRSSEESYAMKPLRV